MDVYVTQGFWISRDAILNNNTVGKWACADFILYLSLAYYLDYLLYMTIGIEDGSQFLSIFPPSINLEPLLFLSKGDRISHCCGWSFFRAFFWGHSQSLRVSLEWCAQFLEHGWTVHLKRIVFNLAVDATERKHLCLNRSGTDTLFCIFLWRLPVLHYLSYPRSLTFIQKFIGIINVSSLPNLRIIVLFLVTQCTLLSLIIKWRQKWYVVC